MQGGEGDLYHLGMCIRGLVCRCCYVLWVA